MRDTLMRAIVRGSVRRISLGVVFFMLGSLAGELQAQNLISVPFTNGFIGARGSSAGTANNVRTFATLEIARIFFIQNSSTNSFELQGNDIPGTMRIVRTNGTTLDIPASANWRQNEGSTTYLIGLLPRPTSPVTLAYSGGSIQITDGSVQGGSSVGGYMAAYAGATLVDGASTNGNAAQVLGGLNSYLATVVNSRPDGPVTVNQLTTSNATPTITGTATLAAGEALSVVLGSVQYTTNSTPAIVRNGTDWSLTLTSPLAVATYSVAATITNADGFTLSDPTSNELVITIPTTSVTVNGSFSANDRVYNGTIAATGSTGSLTLSGVTSPDDVTISGVTLAFQTAAVGTGKTVVIAAVTLGGADAAKYSVSLAGAPTATADITEQSLTISGVTAASKPYDGTTTATLSGTASYVGLAGGESFAVSGTPAATFSDASVGTGKAVTVTGYAAPSTNYFVTQPAGLTANITTRPLTIGGSFTAANKVHDGTTAATITAANLSLVGVVDDEDVELTGVTAAFATANVGTGKLVSLDAPSLTGADAGNYTLNLAGAPTTTASITSANSPLTIGGSFTANDKVYDGTVTATGTTGGLTLVGVTSPDEVTIASVTLAFQTAAVGAGKTVVITGVTLAGADGGEYTVSLAGAPTGTASITARPLTIGGSFTAADKAFDGTTAATLATNALTLLGVLNADDVTLSGLAAAFADAAVGTGKPVAVSTASLTGPAAANYSLSLTGAPTTTASILSAAPPSAPRDVAAVPGDGSLAVTWAAPATVGCTAVSGYLVEYSSNQGQSWTRVTLTSASPTSVSLPGLVNNLAYYVRVAAVNSCGTGAYSSVAGPVVPIAPTRDDTGRLPVSAPGTATSTVGGVPRPVTTEVVQDTIVRVTDGEFALRLHAADDTGLAIPVDTSRTLAFEQSGQAAVGGKGFAPGSFATVYLFTAAGEPLLLATIPVAPDGSFAAAVAIPDGLATGVYTLQVNGIDREFTSRAVALGVEIGLPPPDLILTATPDEQSPAVGDTIIVTVTVTNIGRGPAINAVIPRAFREPGFVVVRTDPLDGTYNPATEQWTIPRIEAGAAARMLLTVVVLPPTESQGSQQ